MRALFRWFARPLLVLTGVFGLAGCLFRSSPAARPSPVSLETREILGESRPSASYYRDRSRLEELGPAFDTVLVALINDRSAKTLARANALVLLADRRSPVALPTLERVLLTSDEEALRAASVTGLQRLASESEIAAGAIRGAVSDPSRIVRLTALQALDVQDVAVMRALLAREEDRAVRAVAEQLLFLAESRGAPLAVDVGGVYQTAALRGEPRLRFRPTGYDATSGTTRGDLLVELPQNRRVPLARKVGMIGGVIPAFFAPDRKAVVYETDDGIWVQQLKRPDTRFIGEGLAPRPIPFTDDFVFLREVPSSRRQTGWGTDLRYTVLRANFRGGVPEPLGELRAVIPRGAPASHTPVRQMVVGETPEGFVLRGPDMSWFPIRPPFGENPAAPIEPDPKMNP